MEQLNKIILRGIVGNIKVSDISGNRMARITLATNYAYKTPDGCAVIETTWHNIIAWEREGITNLDSIQRGISLYIEGRLRQQRFTDGLANEHTVYEVIASKVEQVTEDITMEH